MIGQNKKQKKRTSNIRTGVLFYLRIIYVHVGNKKGKCKITLSLKACTGEAIILLVVETNESTFILRLLFFWGGGRGTRKNYSVFAHKCQLHVQRENVPRTSVPWGKISKWFKKRRDIYKSVFFSSFWIAFKLFWIPAVIIRTANWTLKSFCDFYVRGLGRKNIFVCNFVTEHKAYFKTWINEFYMATTSFMTRDVGTVSFFQNFMIFFKKNFSIMYKFLEKPLR